MHKGTYYRKKLAASRLYRCYEIASPRIKRYLNAEVEHAISNVKNARQVLELGCGYGRVMKEVSPSVEWIAGNDISKESLELARSYLEGCQNYSLFLMDASELAFRSCTFDAVLCVQNGISAFGVDKKRLIAESLRVTKERGVILFSSYSPNIWDVRLEWFRMQSQLGLIGQIDEKKTRNGTIVCKDGFRATTVGGDQFVELFAEFGLKAAINEVDESSIFCKVVKEF